MKKMAILFAGFTASLMFNIQANMTFLYQSHVITPEALKSFIEGTREDRRRFKGIPYDLRGKKVCDLQKSLDNKQHEEKIDTVISTVSKQKKSRLSNDKLLSAQYWTVDELCKKLGFVEPKDSPQRTMNVLSFVGALHYFKALNDHETEMFVKRVKQTDGAFEQILNVEQYLIDLEEKTGCEVSTKTIKINDENLAERFYTAIGEIVKNHISERTSIIPDMYILVRKDKGELNFLYLPQGPQACYNNYDQEVSGWGLGAYVTAIVAATSIFAAGYGSGQYITLERECEHECGRKDECTNNSLNNMCNLAPEGLLKNSCNNIVNALSPIKMVFTPVFNCEQETGLSKLTCELKKEEVRLNLQKKDLENKALNLNTKELKVDSTEKVNKETLEKIEKDKDELNELTIKHNNAVKEYDKNVADMNNSLNLANKKEQELDLKEKNIMKDAQDKIDAQNLEIEKKETDLKLKEQNIIKDAQEKIDNLFKDAQNRYAESTKEINDDSNMLRDLLSDLIKGEKCDEIPGTEQDGTFNKVKRDLNTIVCLSKHINNSIEKRKKNETESSNDNIDNEL